METTVEFDLTHDEVNTILERRAGPVFNLVLRMMAKQMDKLTGALAGPSTITVDDTGIRAVTGGTTRQVPWAQVRQVNERNHAWVFQFAPSGLCMIPVKAVPPAQVPVLTAQLRTLAGAKYHVREGGISLS